tara:strand:+ start:2085 stop:3779 length:1695 start_codon:yes stop_codon:yes gene_type:complete
MGLEKLVVKQVVKVAKDTGRLENTIDTMKIKLMDKGIEIIEKTGLNPADLPFSPQELMSGNIADTSSLLTAEVICNQQPLTNKQKADASRVVESTLASLNNIIVAKNSISGALITIKTPLNTLISTGQTLGSIISTVKRAVKVIKAIPIPTAIIPPSGGIGVPINVLTILSDSLDQLDKLLTYGKGVTKVIPELSGGVVKMINVAIKALNDLDKVINPVFTTMAFVDAIVKVGDSCPNLPQNEINIVKNNLADQLEVSIAASGDSSNINVNNADNATLIEAMSPNAKPPLIYKGFYLVLEQNPDNEFSFPARRIKAFRDFTLTNPGEEVYLTKFQNQITQKTLYNSPNGLNANDYSFSSSVTVLYEEMVYKIDNFLQQLRYGVSADTELEEGDRNVGGGNVGGGNEDPFGPNGENNLNPYVLNGPNIVTPVDEFTGDQVSGTIVVNEPIRVQMTTNGGIKSMNYTNTIITFQKGNKPMNTQLSREAYVTRGNVLPSPPSILTEKGIWNYTMTIVENLGNNGNQSNFQIMPILPEGGDNSGGGGGANAGNDTVIIDSDDSSNTLL